MVKARKSTARVRDSEQLRRLVYEPSDLSQYPFRDRFVIRAADLFFFLLISIICRTVRWKVVGMENLEAILDGGHRAIYSFWHSCIFSATWFWRNRGIVVMSSKSRDGELTGRFIKRFGYGTARGSSSRGAGRALTQMASCLENGIDVAFTLDGPRGPAFTAKPGAVTLARHTGQAILPFHINAAKYFELPTWDRMRIPLPFTQSVVAIGPAMYVSRGASPEDVASKQNELQSTLEQLRSDCERI